MIQFRLKIIGIFPTIKDQNHFNDLVSGLPGNIQISIEKLLPFSEFCKSIGNTHLIFDLRKIDFESTHCLPIKLFYYLACGRPVLYSDLLAIRHHIKEFDFGYLCHPKDIPSIATHITDYIANPGLYLEHAGNALEISRSTYNWKAIENDFLTFIDS